ncbi:hypothetical protein [Corallococcus carmarthensis]|nr:hypothetical protein [Corallococcus carmarthensis]NOK18501.1 hypothetical protein [Corallococcus carmarthensis]
MRSWVGALCVAAGLLTGCEDGLAPRPPEREEAPVVPAVKPPKVHTRRFEVRVKGVNAEAYRAVVLPVAGLRAKAGGWELATGVRSRTVDLATPGHASLVGYVDVPEGSADVELTLTWDEAGGYESDPDAADGAAGAEAGVLDARPGTVRLRVSPAAMARHGRVVLEVDVASSLVKGADGRRFLPRFMTAY